MRKSRANGLSRRWDVAQLERRAIEKSRKQNVAQMDVPQMVCHAGKKWHKWHFPAENVT